MNRKYLYMLIVPFILFCLAFINLIPYEVKYVFDGDTILLSDGQKVRYTGIDAPEIAHEGQESEFMAISAMKFNRELVSAKRVNLEYDRQKKDHYGRLLAYVFLENGDMVNALLVRKGMAYVLIKSQDHKYKDFLLECQRKAMTEEIGIWSGLKIEKEKLYMGNLSSHRFHKTNCPFGKKISRKNLIKFKSRKEAFWHGFSPCKHCNP
ncbi:MAG TPA: thermonuclease family protein [Desulfobacteraceae bacterium]|nr:thermonuclease family protein [Desulfobacteraceae bacterium]HPJ68402.1 thermonuclease family protein [Desulfobacteraceae bacterium]HPQ27234.1 thermonuclease family protein [Desulfobacteraceae bacterium]